MGRWRAAWWPWAAVALGALSVAVAPGGIAAAGPPSARVRSAWCPADMQSVLGRYCVDRYEAYTVELLAGGGVRAHSPFVSVEGKRVKALNQRGRVPQAHISRDDAEQACNNAGKRLCTDAEWIEACKGKRPTAWPYGDEWQPGRCNDQGVSSFNMLFGRDGKAALESDYTWDHLNDPRLNQTKGTCAPAGKFSRCRNSFQLFDMVGNLHEWTAAPTGTFRGGYYLDVRKHGDGCDYKTTAHDPRYHDYSTGFRCCRDPGPARVARQAGTRAEPQGRKGKKAAEPQGRKGKKAAEPQGRKGKKAAEPQGRKGKKADPEGAARPGEG